MIYLKKSIFIHNTHTNPRPRHIRVVRVILFQWGKKYSNHQERNRGGLWWQLANNNNSAQKNPNRTIPRVYLTLTGPNPFPSPLLSQRQSNLFSSLQFSSVSPHRESVFSVLRFISLFSIQILVLGYGGGIIFFSQLHGEDPAYSLCCGSYGGGHCSRCFKISPLPSHSGIALKIPLPLS